MKSVWMKILQRTCIFEHIFNAMNIRKHVFSAMSVHEHVFSAWTYMNMYVLALYSIPPEWLHRFHLNSYCFSRLACQSLSLNDEGECFYGKSLTKYIFNFSYLKEIRNSCYSKYCLYTTMLTFAFLNVFILIRYNFNLLNFYISFRSNYIDSLNLNIRTLK